MFLDTVKFDYFRLRRLSLDYTRWEKFAEVIYTTRITKEEVLQLLQMEILFGQRRMIIQRLYSRFSKIRHKEERTQLFCQRLQDPKIVIDEKGMGSWDHALIRLEEELADPEELQKLIYYEQSHQCRPYMLKLLHGRLTNLRRKQEQQEIKTWRKQVKKTLRSTSENSVKNLVEKHTSGFVPAT